MNILFTGAKSFLAKELADYFSQSKSKYNLILTDRKTLDPTDLTMVHECFDDINVDIVIHTAIKGGKRNHNEHIDDFYSNISMFNNLSRISNKYKLMFNFGSGAEFDRRNDIFRAKEKLVNDSMPIDYYGLSKNIITRKINDLNSNIFNLRLFGCFGPREEQQRLLKNCYNQLMNNQEPVISQDKEMDYFYSKDVGRIIEHIINHGNEFTPRDINMCYEQKYNLSDYVDILKLLTNKKNDVIIKKSGLSKSYSGCGIRVQNLGVELKGLEGGIEECLTNWNKY